MSHQDRSEASKHSMQGSEHAEGADRECQCVRCTTQRAKEQLRLAQAELGRMAALHNAGEERLLDATTEITRLNNQLVQLRHLQDREREDHATSQRQLAEQLVQATDLYYVYQANSSARTMRLREAALRSEHATTMPVGSPVAAENVGRHTVVEGDAVDTAAAVATQQPQPQRRVFLDDDDETEDEDPDVDETDDEEDMGAAGAGEAATATSPVATTADPWARQLRSNTRAATSSSSTVADTEAEEVASAEVAVEADERDTAMLTRYGVLRGGCSRCRGGGKKRRCPESCYVSGARKFVRLMVELD